MCLCLYAPSLDEVLEGVSVCPLLGEGGSVPDGGKVAQTQAVLHALVPAGHLLLLRLGKKRN